ncbi:MAG: response regulator [Chloroflexi bacterium]|nr:response regulator [Chloroflexota bacterium]
MAKVLVVDDEPLVVRLLTLTLPSNYQTLQAKDGREAVALAEQDIPDLVLLDIDMPGLNGFDVLKWVRGSPRMGHARVIVVTGSADETYRERALSLGADAFFTKPFSPLVLLEKITELLKDR